MRQVAAAEYLLTTDDCIIRCNAAGSAWEPVVDCGWAQNFPYSASCLNSQPHPVCQNNGGRGRPPASSIA